MLMIPSHMKTTSSIGHFHSAVVSPTKSYKKNGSAGIDLFAGGSKTCADRSSSGSLGKKASHSDANTPERTPPFSWDLVDKTAEEAKQKHVSCVGSGKRLGDPDHVVNLRHPRSTFYNVTPRGEVNEDLLALPPIEKNRRMASDLHLVPPRGTDVSRKGSRKL